MKCVKLYEDGVGSRSPYDEQHWLHAYCDGKHVVLERRWYFPPCIEDEFSKSSTQVERTRTSKEVLSRVLSEIVKQCEGRVPDNESQEDHAGSGSAGQYGDIDVSYDRAKRIFIMHLWNQHIDLSLKDVTRYIPIEER